MRGLSYLFAVIAVVALAVWAYGQNHHTQQARADVRNLRNEIRQLREAIEVQRAEWAYLNRPTRLRELVDLNFDRLQLVAMRGDNYGRVSDIAYPLPVAIEDIEVVGESAGQGAQ